MPEEARGSGQGAAGLAAARGRRPRTDGHDAQRQDQPWAEGEDGRSRVATPLGSEGEGSAVPTPAWRRAAVRSIVLLLADVLSMSRPTGRRHYGLS